MWILEALHNTHQIYTYKIIQLQFQSKFTYPGTKLKKEKSLEYFKIHKLIIK